ncbi:nitroreductase [Gordonia liuliyuniae]|uniref:Nitroreductase n=1 Tax=Gordonia liuliyuniae TaxID=2911517 RepID=A0ABS9IWC3_9ACTN|nr:nitroreductase [Gordonia liuliyuniae]MCF8589780.1 nitroreductase [Gordonia liuliyuniae]
MTNSDYDTVDRALAERYSCRGFLPDRVPGETLRALFASAQRTASWCNSQAWQVTLVSADDAAEFGDALTAWVASGKPQVMDIDPPTRYEGVYQERRRGAGFALYNAVGVERDDTEGRMRQMAENFRFFGAPHVAVISSPKSLGPYGAVDCGAYVSSLLTVAQSLGLATIAQAAIAMYSDFVHDHLDIPDDRNIVCAVSIGYADDAHPANGFRTERTDVDGVVVGLG